MVWFNDLKRTEYMDDTFKRTFKTPCGRDKQYCVSHENTSHCSHMKTVHKLHLHTKSQDILNNLKAEEVCYFWTCNPISAQSCSKLLIPACEFCIWGICSCETYNLSIDKMAVEDLILHAWESYLICIYNFIVIHIHRFQWETFKLKLATHH